ncbi:MAG: methylamine metabolism protein, partial [Bacteroidota bacterium]
MLHSRKLQTLAVAICSVLFLDSCKKDIDVDANIDNARARKRNNLSAVQQLGKQIFFDARLSEPVGVQSCASCHAPEVGFSGFGDIPTGGAASASGFKRGFVAGIGEGAPAGAFGRRKPPSAAYATFAPNLVYDAVDQAFVGGLFWDGRATGSRLGSTAAEQAQGPFLADKEQNHANPAAVLAKLKNNRAYIALWQAAYGTSDINISTPAAVQDSYDKLGFAIAEYEASAEVNQFTSKWDAYMAGRATLTAQELEGQRLFLNEADCRACHNSTGGNKNRPFQAGELFTDFAYHNIGVPQNANNPGGNASPDLGLGGFLATAANPQWRAMANQEMGKFKTPTLRNVGKAQRFMHNGALRTLEEVVHFYNTRDVAGAGWSAPEYTGNLDVEHVGGLGLTPAQEAAIVAFMRTL